VSEFVPLDVEEAVDRLEAEEDPDAEVTIGLRDNLRLGYVEADGSGDRLKFRITPAGEQAVLDMLGGKL
jgi:hypothetical protein